MGDKLAPLPDGPYNVILADPPWTYTYWGSDPKGTGRRAEYHYPLLSLSEICSLPVQSIAARDSVLLLWATAPNLHHAITVMESWGFIYKTVAFVWVKNTSQGKPATGLGFYTRANAELCLLGTRGKVLPRQSHSVHSIIATPRREHSRKPDEARTRIVQLFGEVPRIELFARQRVSGWDAWGLDVDQTNVFKSSLKENETWTNRPLLLPGV